MVTHNFHETTPINAPLGTRRYINEMRHLGQARGAGRARASAPFVKCYTCSSVHFQKGQGVLSRTTTALAAMLLAIAGACLASKQNAYVQTTPVVDSDSAAPVVQMPDEREPLKEPATVVSLKKSPSPPKGKGKGKNPNVSFKDQQFAGDGQPAIDQEYTRLVYNRVPQCGSSILIELAQKLAVRNNFTLVVDDEFKPDASRIADIISNLPPRTFYVNHCGFWPASPPDVAWINMLRDPVSRTMSGYYYKVDPLARGDSAVRDALQELQTDKKCGCFKREFDTCVRQRRRANCPLDMSSAASYFCSPDEQCSGELARARAGSRYAFVALSDEMVRSVAALEAMLPSWFSGASALFYEMKDHVTQTTERNALTGTVRTATSPPTVLSPSLSYRSLPSSCAEHGGLRVQCSEAHAAGRCGSPGPSPAPRVFSAHHPPSSGRPGPHAPQPPPGTARAVESNRYELDFYEEIKDLFWRRIAAHPKKSKLRTSYWMDFP